MQAPSAEITQTQLHLSFGPTAEAVHFTPNLVQFPFFSTSLLPFDQVLLFLHPRVPEVRRCAPRPLIFPYHHTRPRDLAMKDFLQVTTTPGSISMTTSTIRQVGRRENVEEQAHCLTCRPLPVGDVQVGELQPPAFEPPTAELRGQKEGAIVARRHLGLLRLYLFQSSRLPVSDALCKRLSCPSTFLPPGPISETRLRPQL
jgi:hypothetical protein